MHILHLGEPTSMALADSHEYDGQLQGLEQKYHWWIILYIPKLTIYPPTFEQSLGSHWLTTEMEVHFPLI